MQQLDCQQPIQVGSSSGYISNLHAVKNIEVNDGGGGGGGATYIFTVSKYPQQKYLDF